MKQHQGEANGWYSVYPLRRLAGNRSRTTGKKEALSSVPRLAGASWAADHNFLIISGSAEKIR
jgi:hypothetical protein